jgi:LGFP repeat
VTTVLNTPATAALAVVDRVPVTVVTRVQMATPGGGTISVSPTIYREWVSLFAAKTATGESVQTELGWPLEEFALASGAEAVYFERGAIVLRPDGRAFAVYGAIALHYRDLYDLKTGAGVALGFPLAEEEAIAGGRRQRFDGADIYWNAATNTTCEVQGAIREKWLALGGSSGFLGFPISDELAVMKGGHEIGRSSQFTGGTIYWSGATGAYSVHGAIRDLYVTTYNGPIGALGFPTSDETASPRGLKRYNNFEHGCIVWTASSGALQTFTSLDIFVDNINGSGSHTFWESIGTASVWLYANVHITSNTGIDVHLRLPQSGDYGKPSATPGQIRTISPVRGDMALTVLLDGWDKCNSQADVHLGTISTVFSVDNNFGVNAPALLNDGDFHGTIDMRQKSVDNPNDPNFRRDLWWGFGNPGTPVLSRSQYARTFSDVESSESSAHWWDSMYYDDVYKSIAAGGNCFGMCVESCFAERNDSLFSEPIFPVAQGTAIDEINVKHGYQLGAAYLDWFAANFITLRFWDPIAVFNAAKASWDQRDLPLICLTDASRGSGHCVRPCGPNAFRDTGTQLIIEVANPNAPASDDTLDANQIIIDKATNTYRFVLSHNGSIWTGGHLSGGILSWVPFSAICHQPRTPFWEAVAGVAVILLGAGASTTQMTDDAGRTLYKPERVGTSSRWDDLRVDSGAIPGLVRVPQTAAFLSRGPMLTNALAGMLLATETGPEVYRLVGLPSPYGPAPHQSSFTQLATQAQAAKEVAMPVEVMALNGAAQNGNARLGSVIAAAAAGSSPSRIRHEVSASSTAPYRWGFHTRGSSAVATVSGSNGGSDAFVVEKIGAFDQQITVQAPSAGSARQVQFALRSSVPLKGEASYTISGVALAPGASFVAGLQSDGRTLHLQNAGADATVTLQLQGPTGAPSALKTLAIPAGKTAVVAPSDWANLASAPMQASILAAPGGSVERTLQL